MSKRIGEEIRDRSVLHWVADKGDMTLSLEHELDENSLVIDLGGYTGEWAHKIFARYNCDIEIYEPTQQFVKQIEDRFKNLPDGKITIKNNAVGMGDYQAHLSVDGLATRIDRDNIQNQSDHTSVISVIDAAKVIGTRSVDLLKMNIEGSEYEAFDSLFTSNAIKNVKSIFVQFHPIDDDSINKYNEICNNLLNTHTCMFKYPFIWEKWIKR